MSTIYPGFCVRCHDRGSWLCEDCADEYLPLVSGFCCDRCGHPAVGRRCECREMHPAILKARAFAAYEGWPADTIRLVKYYGERDRIPLLADRMIPALQSIGEVDVIVPIPLHPRRRQWRGFDQADLLAKQLSIRSGLPVEHALQRIRHTSTQAQSSRKERQSNMEKAFALADGWAPRPNVHYVLIDDVYTTGATAGACAEVLEAAGVKQISVLTAVFSCDAQRLERYRSLLSAVQPR